MCDFHSCVITTSGDLYHLPNNSHSGIVEHYKLRENEPHKRPAYVEAEWNGEGEYPGADKVCRVPEGEKLTTKQRATCDAHYRALAEYLSPSPRAAIVAKFAGTEWSDVVTARFNRNHGKLPVELLGLVRRINDERDGFIAGLLLRAGADYSMVWPKFALWLMVDEKVGVLRFAGNRGNAAKAIEGVATLYRCWIDRGIKPERDEWIKVRRAAHADAALAAADAAHAAHAAAAAHAALAALAAHAALAAAHAAHAAAAALAEAALAEAAAARKAQWSRMAEKLTELLKEAK